MAPRSAFSIVKVTVLMQLSSAGFAFFPLRRRNLCNLFISEVAFTQVSRYILSMAASGSVSRRILVVDDDPLVADSIRRMLLFDGHQVEVATGAQEALALFAKAKFELTLLDYEMPRMKGDQLALAIKTLDPAQPIVMFTGYAESVRSQNAKVSGVDVILAKPFDLGALRETLAQLLPPA
jgi:CheY-like chemotaxis protein